MDKEKILEEFEKSVFGDFFAGGTFVDNEKQVMYTSGFKEGFNKAKNMSKQFLSKAIAQTREETIREVEEIIEKGKGYYSSEEMRDGYYILKDLQQSLKSLINK